MFKGKLFLDNNGNTFFRDNILNFGFFFERIILIITIKAEIPTICIHHELATTIHNHKEAINDDIDNRSNHKDEEHYRIINNGNNKIRRPFRSNQYRH